MPTDAAPTGIVIQARMGSRRLPGKVARPWLGTRSMLEIILERLEPLGLPRVVATSIHPADDAIEAIARQAGTSVFRGDENNVLRRFLGAARAEGFDRVVRVCADSPFLSPRLLDGLLRAGRAHPEADYLSYTWAGRPTILAHLGLFAEWVRVPALQRAADATRDPLFLEHVTNYLYQNPDAFRLHWLDTPEDFQPPPNCRLTVDTEADFELSRTVYKDLLERGYPQPDYPELFRYLAERPDLLRGMARQIKQNAK